MINVMSYIGMSLQSEVCLWTLLGLVRTIFDATLFKVNANLKQVWQMNMPPELSLPVQQVLRTMISGVMLVQCFTLYVYLASYIVLLYPVFLEERPTLVLPWLLLAAIRNLLCELTSLALGLGTCVLLGPARPPCVKFLISKVSSIMPAVYMWLLILSYYHTLKMASTFKTFVTLPSSNHDYGLELAVRRRRTKSLFGEEALRRKLMASLYGERQSVISAQIPEVNKIALCKSLSENSSNIIEEAKATTESDIFPLLRLSPSNARLMDTACSEEWPISEVTMPRDTDRILEQFGLMMLRIAAYVHKEGIEQMTFLSPISLTAHQSNIEQTLHADTVDADLPSLQDGNSRVGTVTYLQEYPEIFMKKPEVNINLKPVPNISTNETAREVNVEGSNKKRSMQKVSKTTKTHSIDVENRTNRKTKAADKINSQKTSKQFEDSLLIEPENMLRPRLRTKRNKHISDTNGKINKSSHTSSTSADSIKSNPINENKNKIKQQFSKCVGTNSQRCCDTSVESSNSNVELFKLQEKYIAASSSETSLSRNSKICSTCNANSDGDECIETEEMLSTSKNNVTNLNSNDKRSNVLRNKAEGKILKSAQNNFKICDICVDSNSSNSDTMDSSTNNVHERNNS